MSPVNPQPPGPAEEVLSPCVGVCTVGPGDLCIGCLRTTGEIGNWLGFTPSQRQHIMSELPLRLEKLFAV